MKPPTNDHTFQNVDSVKAIKIRIRIELLTDRQMCDSNNREVRSHIQDPLNTLYVIRNFILQITLVNTLYSQFFAHPVINTLMSEKWHGELGMKRKQSWLTKERWTWGFLNIWCLFDLVLFPFLFLVFGTYHFVRKKIRNRKGKINP